MTPSPNRHQRRAARAQGRSHRVPTPEFVARLSPEIHVRIADTLSVLRVMAHGPGQVGVVVMGPDADNQIMWLPIDGAIEFLQAIERADRWHDRLRTFPPEMAPVLIVLPDAGMLLSALVGDAGMMSPGGNA